MANLFWVGGSSTWDGVTNRFATTSGGAATVAAPTLTDNVFFDAASGAATVTSSGTNVNQSANMDFTGFTGTFVHNTSTQIQVAGNLKLVAGMTYTRNASASWFFNSSTPGHTIDFGGKTTIGNVTFTGAGGGWQFTSGFTGAASAFLTFNSGTLDFNGQTISYGAIVSNNSNTRTITMGAANLTLTGTGTVLDFTTTTGLTFNANTSTITVNGANVTFTGNGTTFNNVVFSGAGSALLRFGTFANLTRTGTAVKGDTFVITGSQTVTVTGLLTITGNSVTNRLFVFPGSNNATATLNAASVSITNTDFQDIIGAGVAVPFTGTSVGSGGGNTNITAPAVTRFWVGNGGNFDDTAHWSATSGGASGASVPLPQDTCVWDANSFSLSGQTMASNSHPRLGGNWNWSAVTNAPSISFAATTALYGSVTLGPGFGAWNNSVTLAGRGARTITTAGVRLAGTWSFNAWNGGSYTLQDSVTFTTTGAITHNGGILDFNGFNVAVQSITSNAGLNQDLRMGSGTTTLRGTGTILNVTNNTNTFTADQATVVVTDVSATSKTLSWTVGTGSTTRIIGTIYLPQGGSGAVILAPSGNGSNGRFGNLIVFGPKTVQAAISGTQTAIDVLGDITFVSGPSEIVTFTSTVSGTPVPISKTTGRVVIDYASIQDVQVGGGATFYGGTHSTNVSGNTGWIFQDERHVGASRAAAGTRTVATRTLAGARTTVRS